LPQMDNVKFGLETTVLPNKSSEFFSNIEKNGFDSIWVNDHFLPWSDRDAERFPYTNFMQWVYLPLILNYTSKVKVGTAVTCPLFRYHPAIVAQYFAQLDWTFPGRVILGVGTGEMINENPFGLWPNLKERRERLAEAVKLIRMLWENKDYFTFEGKYYQLKNAKLYVRPKEKIPIIISAGGPKAAKLAGEIGDGIMVFAGSPAEVEDRILKPYREGVKKAGKKFEETERAIYIFGGVVDPNILTKILKGLKRTVIWALEEAHKKADPREIDQLVEAAPESIVLEKAVFVTSTDELIGRLEKYVNIGINHFIFADFTSIIARKPDEISDIWSKKIIPYFKGK